MSATLSWWGVRLRVFAAPTVRPPLALLLAVACSWLLVLDHGHAHKGHSMGIYWELQAWILMVVAMMLPLQGPPLSGIRRTTLPGWRSWAQTAYLVGWLLPWLVVGLGVALLRQSQIAHWPFLAPIAFLLAALWHRTSAHRKALARCHLSRPLAPKGWPLARDASREGWVNGWSCCVSCAPLMLACTLTGHHLLAMIVGFLSGWLERASFRPAVKLAASMSGALGTYFFYLAL